jgi:large conductance mechanosensitive channel
MLNEFKSFIARGNVMDMAVGIIVGAAFTAIVSSLVKDMINPVIGLVIGGLDFSNYYLNLGSTTFATLSEAQKAGAPVIAYGSFINSVLQFLIVAFVVFLMVRGVNRMKAEFERKAADSSDTSVTPPADVALLTEIRDLLKK